MALSEDFIEKRIHPVRSGGGFEELLELDIRMCQICVLDYAFQWGASSNQSKYSGINQPHKIHRFDASLNELTELNEVGIKAFTNLKVLDVSLNRISSVCDLDQFHSLTSLNLSHNRIIDISFLRNVNTLIELNMSMNDIEDVSCLPSLVSLSVLQLNDNKLRSLEGIQALPYLKELHIQRNNVTNLVPLTSNRNLAALNAAHNEIDSLNNTVNTLRYLSNLKSIILFGNPVEKEKNYQRELLKLDSLSSLDNVTTRKGLSHLTHRSETENMGNLKDAASQAFWNQLTLKRGQMEENVRYLQQRILQQQEEFRDYEAGMKSNLDTTLMHLNSLTLDARNPHYTTSTGIDPYSYDMRHRTQIAPAHPPYHSSPHGVPPYQPPQIHVHPQDMSHRFIDPGSKYNKGDFRGITDTDEVLRLASNELTNDKRHNQPML